MFCLKPEIITMPRHVCDTHSGSSDPNLSLSLSLSLVPSLWWSRSFCSHTERYFGLCFSQSRRVSQACLCSDSLVKLTANAIRAVRLSFFSSIHLMKKKRRQKEEQKISLNAKYIIKGGGEQNRARTVTLLNRMDS